MPISLSHLTGELMPLDAHLLKRPPAEGVRAIALDLLDEARRSLARLERGSDEEALHDFRVALRRLRSTLRAFSSRIDAVGRRELRRLKKLASQTASSRDAQVQLAWLAREREGLAPRALPAVEWLSQRLQTKRRESDEESRALVRRFERLSRRLVQRLETETARRHAARSLPPLGRMLAELLRQHAAELDQRLGEVHGPLEVAAGHRARIAAKRLRYLLEPLREIPDADSTEAVAPLKRLQDLLGELQDAHVAIDLLKTSLVDAAAERALRAHAAIQQGAADRHALRAAMSDDLTRGLLILDRKALERAHKAYQGLVEEWLPRDRPVLAEVVARVVRDLESGDRERPALLRRFLLMRLPAEAQRVPTQEIDIGWIHGPRLRESVSRVRDGDSVRFFRGETGREGSPPNEEEITEERFAQLWASTEGHRLHKQRHCVLEGGRTWFVDDLVDLQRHLLDVPTDERESIDFPAWLSPLIVREVTDERAYHDARLAGRRRRAPARQTEQPAESEDATPHRASTGSGAA